jgi:hypothetical protein
MALADAITDSIFKQPGKVFQVVIAASRHAFNSRRAMRPRR